MRRFEQVEFNGAWADGEKSFREICSDEPKDIPLPPTASESTEVSWSISSVQFGDYSDGKGFAFVNETSTVAICTVSVRHQTCQRFLKSPQLRRQRRQAKILPIIF
jgi:hypothetical protein